MSSQDSFFFVFWKIFSKVFDVIDQDRFLRKLALHGLSKDTLKLIASFVSNRQQLVSVNVSKSDLIPLKYGVPQGLGLDPLFLSLYINELPLFIPALCELFADDTSIHSGHSVLTDLSLSLQESVHSLFEWTELNHVSLKSHQKTNKQTKSTKCMYITTRVVGAPQMTLLPVFSIFTLFSTTLWDLPNSRPVHSLMLSSHLFLCPPCLLPLSLCLARWFWPDLMNGRHDHTTAVCVSLRWPGGLCVARLPAGSWHGLPRW